MRDAYVNTMEYYLFIEALLGVIGGLLLIFCTKKAQGVTYGRLDKAGIVTNILMTIVYVLISPLYIFIGVLSAPAHDGFLGIIGWIVSTIMSSVAMFCALGIGGSVALRKRGKSKLSFAVQFAGAASILIMLGLFFLFYGNLLRTLN